MGKIRVLDEATINKIAAGEVIENPAAIVKELVENSIDAESNSITVEIKEGGTSLIRVTDNGLGIEREDLVTAFLPHATSKIRNLEDIFSVTSLGFRGEALPSIASVSKVEVLSKTADSLTGTIYVVEGGIPQTPKEIGVPEGTTFVVRDIFYNTPARKKFLKSANTEGRYVLDVMEHLALSHPEISFKFITNGQLKFQTVGNGNLKDVIYYMYGKDVTAGSFPLSAFSPREGYKIHGFLGKPALIRGNREYETYFINGRYIKSKIITKAIEDAYKPYIMGGKYPFTCLFLELNAEFVDVNVHPTKLEVRFSDAEAIYHLVYHAITESLSEKELIPDAGLATKPEKTSMVRDLRKESFVIPDIPMPEPFENKRADEWKKEMKPLFRQESFVADIQEYKKTASYESLQSEKEKSEPIKLQSEKASEIEDEPILMQPKILPDIRMIGQVFGTYWIIQYGDKVYMIDQHAAHEKVMFERFVANLKADGVVSQNLFPPVLVTLSESQSMIFSEIKDEILRLGFEVEAFGGSEYVMKAVPAELFGLSERDAFIEMLDEAASISKQKLSDNTLNKLATRACKAAIKGNHTLSEAEAIKLIKDLMSLENPYNCPHGRPTMIFISQAEIEKKFKRQL